MPEAPKILFDGLPEELETVLRSWKGFSSLVFEPVDVNGLAQQLFHLQQPVLVVLSNSVCQDPCTASVARKSGDVIPASSVSCRC